MITYDILIPAFNAEQHIRHLLEQIKGFDHQPGTIFLVDDGSADNTSAIANEYDLYLKKWSENQGKGAALKAGYDLYLNNSGTEYLLCMDADLQHPVQCIRDFLHFASETKQPFIIGNRQKKLGIMPIHRIISNFLTSLILSLFTGQRIKDSQCGFRLIHRDVLASIRHTLRENGFQSESEFLIRAASMGYPIDFISIPTVYGGERSSIKNVFDTIKFIRFILQEMIHRI